MLPLLMLLLTAVILRPAPTNADQQMELQTNEGMEQPGLANLYWPMEMEMAKSPYYEFPNNNNNNGSPFRKFKAKEMTGNNDVEIQHILARAFNFPPKAWKLRQQGYRQQLKQLQMQQTWLGQLPPPATYALADVRPHDPRLWKREPARYKPSISAGVVTNLGDFFKQLQANVRFAEQSEQLGEEESQLLEGVHPHQQPQKQHQHNTLGENPDNYVNNDNTVGDDSFANAGQRKTSKLLQTVHNNYRPSQKIRSLVSRNPNGYRGSQFIDPSYMWLGLGK